MKPFVLRGRGLSLAGALVFASAALAGCGEVEAEEPLAPELQESRPETPVASEPAGQAVFIPNAQQGVSAQAVGDPCYICGNSVSEWCFFRGYWKSPNWRYIGTIQYQNGVYGCLAYTNNWECTNSC